MDVAEADREIMSRITALAFACLLALASTSLAEEEPAAPDNSA